MMTLRELYHFFEDNAPTIYKVEGYNIIEYKTKKDYVCSIADDSFQVPFEKPIGWGYKHTLPFIEIIGINENNKLILRNPNNENVLDEPFNYIGVCGNFFLTEKDAKKALLPTSI